MKESPSVLLAQGRTAEIYRWDEHHVLKLFRDWCPSDWVDYEARIARAVYEAGIPSPAAGEIVEVRGRRGLIYERLEGVSMLQDMTAHPWKFFSYARLLAELQIQVNGKSIAGLPTYKDRLRSDIQETPQLGEDLHKKVLAMLEALLDGENLCHGDYHPGNVILSKRGPVVIDWMTACSGIPWAEVARTSLILGMAAKTAGKQVHPMLRMLVGLFHRVYINRYRKLNPDKANALNSWKPVIAAARLNEDIVPEREALLKIVQES